MSISQRAVLGIMIILTIVEPGAAQDPMPVATPAEVGLSADGLDRVTELLDRFVSEGKIAGAVAGVAREGRQVYLEAVGYQDLETRSRMQSESLFRIYSMTKPVTAVAAMILHEEGQFDLDDPVSMYLPEFAGVRVQMSDGPSRPPTLPITVRDLMLHTAGLSHRGSQLYRDLAVRSRSIPMEQFIRNITSAPLMEDPGERFRYSAAPTVLGALVEVWSGSSLDVFLRALVFEPLGMNQTGFWVEPSRAERLTTVYERREDGALVRYQIEDVPFTERPQLLEGAVGLVSTVSDFMRFSQMLLNGGELDGVRILEPETVSLMTANGLTEAPLATRRSGTGWGLSNVSVMLDPSTVDYPTSVGEYGWDGSAGTIFWVNPTEDLVIVLMWQSSPANPEGLRQQAKALIHEALIR